VAQGTQTFHVQPVTAQAMPDRSGAFAVSMGQDLLMPIFQAADGSDAVLLPLKGATLQGTLSRGQNCIGSYNAAGLDPANACVPDATTPAFLTGGQVSALISLEDADLVIITSLHTSLCVVLSGDSTMYGETNPQGITVCKRDGSGQILFAGDAAGRAAPAPIRSRWPATTLPAR
jgi:hypothetical protein